MSRYYDGDVGHAIRTLKTRNSNLQVEIKQLRNRVGTLENDQGDWCKGVELIASALGCDSLCCVTIAERALELRARLEQALELLRQIENLEAVFLLDDHVWDRGPPVFTEKQYDLLMQLQGRRNEILYGGDDHETT